MVFELEKGYLVDTTADPVNPTYVALQKYQEQGYNLEFKTEAVTLPFLGENMRVLCHDTVQNINLSHRLDLLEGLPDYKFLTKAYKSYNLTALEQIAGKRIGIEAQLEIPAVEHIKLLMEDLRGGLALAYHRWIDSEQKIIDNADIAQPGTMGDGLYMRARNNSFGMMMSESTFGGREIKIAEVKAKLDNLGSDPLNADRMKFLVWTQINRVEAFL